MATKYTREELDALHKKEENPRIDVTCPRCGAMLYYRAIGNSYEVKCLTDGCIKLTVRGI